MVPTQKIVPSFFPVEKEALILDIETTGLSPEKHALYGIGLFHATFDGLMLTQGFITTLDEEKELLLAFLPFFKNAHKIYVYNGTNFDLPFLETRYRHYQLIHEGLWDGKQIVEVKKLPLFKNLSPLTSNRRERETLLGFNRTITSDGKSLVKTIQIALKSPTPPYTLLIATHNQEDLESIVFFLMWTKLLAKLKKSYYIDAWCEEDRLYLEGKLPHQPFSETPDSPLFTYKTSFCEVSINTLTLQILLELPLYQSKLKYYLPNYKAYYYIPSDQTVMHQSVAKYIAPHLKQKATKAQCFVEKEGLFLQLPTTFFKDCAIFKDEKNTPYLLYDETLKNKVLWEKLTKGLA